jgi:hypothetical protein
MTRNSRCEPRIRFATQAAKVPSGSGPAARAKDRSAQPSVASPMAANGPDSSTIQPIVFRGWRATISAPIPVKVAGISRDIAG